MDIGLIKKYINERKVAIYGADSLGLDLLNILERGHGINVDFFVDRKADSLGIVYGKAVKSCAQISMDECYCVIASFKSFSAIEQLLQEMGFKEKLDYCGYFDVDSQPVTIEGVPIGKHTFGFSVFMDALASIRSIGSFCSINKTASIGKDHAFLLSTSAAVFNTDRSLIKYLKQHYSNLGQVSIGSDVWIGANTFINASKVKTIGNGAVIGTGAVVVDDVPPYALVVGVPAKVKKYRFTQQQIEVLETVKWWEWSDEQIAENIEMFSDYNLFFDRYSAT